LDLLIITVVASLFGLIIAAYFTRDVLGAETGTPKMRDVADAIREGAEAFIKRQYSTIAILAIVLAILIFGVFTFSGKMDYAWHTSVAFVFGAFCSALAGIIGMWIAVRPTLRSPSAIRQSTGKAVVLALRGGAVSGLTVVALSLLGVSLIF
jgi:K(+)-stimulated pyrophosphate-energized sodium pump